MKLPASTTAGIPDWLHASEDDGARLVEAKTREACERAGTPWAACSKAQQFVLRMLDHHAGSYAAVVLVLGEEGYVELTVQEAQRRDWGRRRQQAYE